MSWDKKTFFQFQKMVIEEIIDLKKLQYQCLETFAFCRYVNDDETWESYLEDEIKMNINNYGVGKLG